MTTEESHFESLISRTGCYAGIGSRSTPTTVLILIEAIAEILAARGMTLRSGAALGADTAFERGCDKIHGKKEIYLPRYRFNGSTSHLYPPSRAAEVMASLYHPNWRACNWAARQFHARNCHQVFGKDLDDPVRFIVFWAPERNGVVAGGTAMAVNLARQNGIPTFNLLDQRTREEWIALVNAGHSK